MPAFPAADGTELAYHVHGEGIPLVCVPGGPMRASAYLGDLGGLSAHRQLIMLDLRGTGRFRDPGRSGSYRCDRLVDDVAALQDHLGLDRCDLLGHSAGGNIAVQYAARHQARVSKLALITPSARSAGFDPDAETRRQIVKLRQGEPWFAEAAAAFERIAGGSGSDDDWEAIAPFFYGRWDAAAQATRQRDRRRPTRSPPGPSVPKGHSIRRPPVPRSPRSARPCWCSRAASTCSGPRRCSPSSPPCSPRPGSPSSQALATIPWLDDPAGSSRRSPRS